MPTHQLVFLIGAGTAFICSFMPWVRVAFLSVSGSDGDGVISAIAAALAFGLGLARMRVPHRALVLTRFAAAAAAVAFAVYVYNLVRLSTARPAENALFDITPSLQFGIVVGTISAAVATCIGVLESVRRSDTGPWSPSTTQLAIATVAAAGIAVVGAWSLWLLTALIAVALIGLTFASRDRLSRKALTGAGAMAALLVTGAVVGAIQNSSSKPSEAKCDDVFTSGAKTADVSTTKMCTKDGSKTLLFTMTTECNDGRTLVTNDYGWGYLDDKWQTDGDAPRAACTSDATELCTDIFSSGANTQKVWGDDIVECFKDAAKSDVDMVFSMEWSCFDSNKRYIMNDFGWGYVDEPWQQGEPPSC